MIAYKDIKKFNAFKLDCPHLYKDCGSIIPKSDCIKCFKDKKYNIRNGHNFGKTQRKECPYFNKVAEMSKTLSR